MEHYKTSKLLKDSTVLNFLLKKIDWREWFISPSIFCQQNIIFKTTILTWNFCDYGDTYIAVKGKITAICTTNSNRRNKKIKFKNNSSFRSCILKINNTLIDNSEDLDVAMPMYNLLEYSDNYFMKSGSLSNYQRDEVNDDANGIDATDDNNNENNK